MYEQHFLQALSITVVIETLLLFLLVRCLYQGERTEQTDALLLFSGILASAATLPYIWFIWPAFIKSHYLYRATSEIFAVLAETVIYYFLLKLSLKKCFIISLVCNMASYIGGRLLA